MYRFASDIPNEESPSFIPDVAFHPSGSMFAVIYGNLNQVRVFDSSTCTLLRTYRNPRASLDWPHGVLMTDRHIIVSNKHLREKPSILTAYRIDDPSGKPITVFATPVKHLREAHSLALHGHRLLITYCGKNIGAVVSYHFDDDTGMISGPTSIQEAWFVGRGEPKGVCFNDEGTKAVITLVTEKAMRRSYWKKVQGLRKLLGEKKGIRKVIGRVSSKCHNIFMTRKEKIDKTHNGTNGIVIFDVDKTGVLSKDPAQTVLTSDYCRLENISIVENLCAVADPLNDTVSLYNFDGYHFPNTPTQVIQDTLAFPHDVCFSPDKKKLVITNNGIEVIDGQIQWHNFIQPRCDKITIYEIEEVAQGSRRRNQVRTSSGS